MEIFKDVVGFEGLYVVSNEGNIFGLKRGKVLKATPNKYGYLQLELNKDNKPHYFKVARLVAIAFIPNPDNKENVNHIDGNKVNNNVKNLEWVTAQENTQHAIDTGLRKTKLNMEQVGEIRKLHAKGVTCVQLGKLFNVTRCSILQVVKGAVYDDDNAVKNAYIARTAKVTPDLRDEVMELLSSGEKPKNIAAKVGISPSAVSQIKRGLL